MSLIEKVNKYLIANPVLDMVLRVGIPVVLLLVLLLGVIDSFVIQIILLTIIGVVLVPLGVSFSMWATGTIKFSSVLLKGEDNIYSEQERAAAIRYMGYLAIAMGLVICGSFVGAYQSAIFKKDFEQTINYTKEQSVNQLTTQISDSTEVIPVVK